MTETRAILMLSKATLSTGGLESLRAQINATQNQKCLGLKDLLLAALLAPRQGPGPNRWHESLACITANQQSRLTGGFQRCPLDESEEVEDFAPHGDGCYDITKLEIE